MRPDEVWHHTSFSDKCFSLNRACFLSMWMKVSYIFSLDWKMGTNSGFGLERWKDRGGLREYDSSNRQIALSVSPKYKTTLILFRQCLWCVSKVKLTSHSKLWKDLCLKKIEKRQLSPPKWYYTPFKKDVFLLTSIICEPGGSVKP